MKKIILSIALVLPMLVFAQAPEATKPAPSTKLEAFSGRTGIVVVKGYSELGGVAGLGGRVNISAREFRDASNPKVTVYGVAFEVKESGRLERENTSFIDEDEIEALIRGLDYIQKINRSVTTMGSFEAQYRTKGDFSATVFSSSDSSISVALSSGRIGRTNVYLKLHDLERVRALVEEAKIAIATAKAGK